MVNSSGAGTRPSDGWIVVKFSEIVTLGTSEILSPGVESSTCYT
jgi:hypothetical protein